MRLLKRKSFSTPIVFIIIASLLICMACSSYGNAGCYFATRNSDFNASKAQLLGMLSSYTKEVATQETISTSSALHYGISYVPNRTSRTLYRLNVITQLLMPILFSVSVYLLHSYGSHGNSIPDANSICITRYIEHSDGKK